MTRVRVLLLSAATRQEGEAFGSLHRRAARPALRFRHLQLSRHLRRWSKYVFMRARRPWMVSVEGDNFTGCGRSYQVEADDGARPGKDRVQVWRTAVQKLRSSFQGSRFCGTTGPAGLGGRRRVEKSAAECRLSQSPPGRGRNVQNLDRPKEASEALLKTLPRPTMPLTAAAKLPQS